ncbi:MAG: hypothetical protein EAZ55_09025 [Cytophagales bacterium]|nr:MAG: hypothetical protein EAZ55_09025 [Cytophagales bacterium]
MFTEIKTFVEAFLQAEADAKNAQNFPDLGKMRSTLQQLNSFCVNELHNTFGILPQTELESLEHYSKKQTSVPKHLAKISQYQHDTYGEVFLAYVWTFTQYVCFAIIREDGAWKIVQRFELSNDSWRTHQHGKRVWIQTGGQDIFAFDNFGSFVAAERFEKPWHDVEMMEDFILEK